MLMQSLINSQLTMVILCNLCVLIDILNLIWLKMVRNLAATEQTFTAEFHCASNLRHWTSYFPFKAVSTCLTIIYIKHQEGILFF